MLPPDLGVDVEIARAELEDRIELLPAGEIGEVVIRGHNVMKGYWNRPDATKAAIVDGWFRSGDLAVKDEQGFISIVDRKKDMVLRGGFNVYPREVEEVLARHPWVHQVSVIGIPDRQYGEEICAVVVKDPSAAGVADDQLRAEITGYAKQHLAKYKYPRRIELMDSLPPGPRPARCSSGSWWSSSGANDYGEQRAEPGDGGRAAQADWACLIDAPEHRRRLGGL